MSAVAGTRSHGVRRRKPRRCPCGCGEMGLCLIHLARLGQIRSDLAEVSRKKGRKGQSECQSAGCRDRRVPGTEWCEAHGGDGG
jgi:hypothetical protein